MEKKQIIGIDVGGTYVRIGLVDRKGNLSRPLIEKTVNIFKDEKAEGLCTFIREYIAGSAAKEQICALSAGFPSTVDKKKEKLISTPNIPGLNGLEIHRLLKEYFNFPIMIDRDVIMLFTFDLHRNRINDSGIAIGCYFGTGIGNVVSVGGHILEGKNGVAGELGHIPVYGNKKACGCGNTGCIETIAAGRYLSGLAEAEFNGEFIGDLFKKHSKHPKLDYFLDMAAVAVATEVNILDPDYVMIGGGIISMDAFPMEEFTKRITNHVRKPLPAESIHLIYTKDTSVNGIIGAGLYGFKKAGL